jgi:arginine utilization regulatory protein
LRPEEFFGSRVTSFYRNLNDENSTLLSVIKTEESLCNVRQEMITNTGNEYISMNTSFPIKQRNNIIGAIEISKHFYKKKDIRVISQIVGPTKDIPSPDVYTNSKIWPG